MELTLTIENVREMKVLAGSLVSKYANSDISVETLLWAIQTLVNEIENAEESLKEED